MTMFMRPRVEFEARQFTGSNFDELREFTGTRKAVDGDDIFVVNPIGTFLPAHLYDDEITTPLGEIFDEVSRSWQPLTSGQWIVQQDEGWTMCTDEWIRINCIELDEEMQALIREQEREKSFEEELAGLINKHSMENLSGTPDFLLARFLKQVLHSFGVTVKARAHWRGESVKTANDMGLIKSPDGRISVPPEVGYVVYRADYLEKFSSDEDDDPHSFEKMLDEGGFVKVVDVVSFTDAHGETPVLPGYPMNSGLPHGDLPVSTEADYDEGSEPIGYITGPDGQRTIDPS